MTSSLLSEGACLDNNHSHFILVDDGTVGKYGGEIPFRASLQNCITTKKIARSEYVRRGYYSCAQYEIAAVKSRMSLVVAVTLDVQTNFSQILAIRRNLSKKEKDKTHCECLNRYLA